MLNGRERIGTQIAERSGMKRPDDITAAVEDSPARAAIAYAILSKALDTTKLVRVQRPVTRGGKTFMSHRWVKPEGVKKTDTVIGNRHVYEAWQKEQSRKAAAQTNPGTGSATGTAAGHAGLKRLNAALAKKRKAKADAARAQAATTPAKPAPAKSAAQPKSAADSKSATAKTSATDTKKPAAKKTAADAKANTDKPAARKTAARKTATDTKAKTDKPAARSKTAKSKTPVKSADSKARTTGRTTSKAADKAKTTGTSAPRADAAATKQSADAPATAKTRTPAQKTPKRNDPAASGQTDKLDTSLATTERERAILDLINTIDDPEILDAAISTGVVAADAESLAFARDQLLKAYTAYNTELPTHQAENVQNALASFGAPKNIHPAGAFNDYFSLWFSTLMLDPCEAIAGISGVRPTPTERFNPFAQWSVELMCDVLWGERMESVLRHIASTQPELKDECHKMISEWDNMRDENYMYLFRRYNSDPFGGTGLGNPNMDKAISSVLDFFGISYEFDGGYKAKYFTSLDDADKRRLHQKSSASPEREAVIANMVLSAVSLDITRDLHGPVSPLYSGKPDPDFTYDEMAETLDKPEINRLPTFGMTEFQQARAYREAMPAYQAIGSLEPHMAQDWNTALRYAEPVPDGAFFKDDPSPMKDLLYKAMQYSFSFATDYDEPDESMHTPFGPQYIPDLSAQNADVPKTLKRRREEAFAAATCTVRQCTAEETQEAYDRIDSTLYDGLDPNDTDAREAYESRLLIKRRVFKMENSKMEEEFWKLVGEQGLDVFNGFNGISFNNFCAVCKAGAHKVADKYEENSTGAMLGFGVYIALSALKSMMYAGSKAFSAQRLEVYEDEEGYDDYSDGYEADGVISLVKATLGQKTGTFDSASDALMANRNMGGDCDSVRVNAGSYGGGATLKADEICITAANMMFPEFLVEVSGRMRGE